MIKTNVNIKLSDLKNVLRATVEELKMNQNKLSASISKEETEKVEV